MQVELYVAIMGGFVLAFFLSVGEIALLRKRLRRTYESGSKARFIVEASAIVAFFLVQPFLIAFLVMLALNQVNPNFMAYALQQLERVTAAIFN
jgi:uncharacterized BrkB/YihY/UPF0761 family membrane protein